jgi:hypothetical protein
MSKQTVNETPEFPARIKPVRVGVYRTTFGSETTRGWGFSRWDGKRWSNERPTALEAAEADTSGAIQKKRWIGLAEKSGVAS